ncbi:MAG: hypothetical protein KDH19_11225 [Geminicoccaceae bacterium]|nr:hypothetical protein [Geminicoccaceae bacterium]
MTNRKNPLKLNALQLKTMAILQYLARQENWALPADEDGNVVLRGLPSPHGDHFHVGDALVRARDATGLFNRAVYTALGRRGLVTPGTTGFPAITPMGLEYDTGISADILHRSDH